MWAREGPDATGVSPRAPGRCRPGTAPPGSRRGGAPGRPSRGAPLYSGPCRSGSARSLIASSSSGPDDGPSERGWRSSSSSPSAGWSVALAAPTTSPVQGAGSGVGQDRRPTPATFDPAAQSDVGTAAVIGPALREPDGLRRRVLVRARPWPARGTSSTAGGGSCSTSVPGLAFSDGTPITAADVVRSWLRVIDPAHPSPLASLMGDVDGANDYLAGVTTDPSTVGLRAVGLRRRGPPDPPERQFPAIVASPTFGVVPARRRRTGGSRSGGVRPPAHVGGRGRPPGERPLLGRAAGDRDRPPRDDARRDEPVAAFAAGDVDYTAISAPTRRWIAYDPTLGPSLRAVPSLSLEYLGFDVRQKPFDDVRVRQAFAPRGRLGADRRAGLPRDLDPGDEHGPAGHPGPLQPRLQPHADPAQAKALLAAAGYPGGAGFPTVTLRLGGERHRRRRSCASSTTCSGSRSSTRRWTSATTSPAWPPIRRRCGRSAGSPTTRARTTSWASSSAPASRTTTATGARRSSTRRSPTRGAATDPAAILAGLRAGRGGRPARRPGHPAVLRVRLGARPDGAARRGRQRPRHHPPGRPGVGAVSARACAVACASAALVAGRDRRASRRGGRGDASARPSASSTFGTSLSFSQPIDVGSSDVTRTEILLLFAGRRSARRSSRSAAADGRPLGRAAQPHVRLGPARPMGTSSRTRSSRPPGG